MVNKNKSFNHFLEEENLEIKNKFPYVFFFFLRWISIKFRACFHLSCFFTYCISSLILCPFCLNWKALIEKKENLPAIIFF